jgi:urease accessory protein
MLRQLICGFIRVAAIFAAATPLAHAHHAMDYALPATAWDGLLSGLGHPVIGVDHLLFVMGAGVLAARLERGYLLPLFFVAASVALAGMRYVGTDVELSELWVAGSLVILGAILLATRAISGSAMAVLFLVAGALHGYALAEAVVGAERTPLVAYLVGLTIIQSAIAWGAGWVARWLAVRQPRAPVQRLAGALVGLAGLTFAGMAALS